MKCALIELNFKKKLWRKVTLTLFLKEFQVKEKKWNTLLKWQNVFVIFSINFSNSFFFVPLIKKKITIVSFVFCLKTFETSCIIIYKTMINGKFLHIFRFNEGKDTLNTMAS